jgi:hypothetical protein
MRRRARARADALPRIVSASKCWDENPLIFANLREFWIFPTLHAPRSQQLKVFAVNSRIFTESS